MDLKKIKEALDKGKVFEGVDEFKDILKKSGGIDDLSNEERREVLDNRQDRAQNDWDNLTEDQKKEMKEDDRIKLEKRAEAQKNEMELAEIQVLENENIVIEEYISNLQGEINHQKRKIDSNVIRIDELNEIVEKNK